MDVENQHSPTSVPAAVNVSIFKVSAVAAVFVRNRLRSAVAAAQPVRSLSACAHAHTANRVTAGVAQTAETPQRPVIVRLCVTSAKTPQQTASVVRFVSSQRTNVPAVTPANNPRVSAAELVGDQTVISAARAV